MRSSAKTVDAYMNELPAERRDPLAEVRVSCRRSLVGFDEAMVYGMPSYSRDGVVEIAFASQKTYISLYVLRSDVLNRYRGEFSRASLGKGCIRFRSASRIDMPIVEAILAETAASRGPVC
jgi:uncharacterized protein YdhG (YjbR/CyaY superfamily)